MPIYNSKHSFKPLPSPAFTLTMVTQGRRRRIARRQARRIARKFDMTPADFAISQANLAFQRGKLAGADYSGDALSTAQAGPTTALASAVQAITNPFLNDANASNCRIPDGCSHYTAPLTLKAESTITLAAGDAAIIKAAVPGKAYSAGAAVWPLGIITTGTAAGVATSHTFLQCDSIQQMVQARAYTDDEAQKIELMGASKKRDIRIVGVGLKAYKTSSDDNTSGIMYGGNNYVGPTYKLGGTATSPTVTYRNWVTFVEESTDSRPCSKGMTVRRPIGAPSDYDFIAMPVSDGTTVDDGISQHVGAGPKMPFIHIDGAGTYFVQVILHVELAAIPKRTILGVEKSPYHPGCQAALAATNDEETITEGHSFKNVLKKILGIAAKLASIVIPVL